MSWKHICANQEERTTASRPLKSRPTLPVLCKSNCLQFDYEVWWFFKIKGYSKINLKSLKPHHKHCKQPLYWWLTLIFINTMKNKKWDKRQLENSAFDQWWQKDTTEVNKRSSQVWKTMSKEEERSNPIHASAAFPIIQWSLSQLP